MKYRRNGYLCGRHDRRSPCGERGLKCKAMDDVKDTVTSLPVRGAWVEIFAGLTVSVVLPVAPRAGSVG